jgi:pilus assembly protein CpaB
MNRRILTIVSCALVLSVCASYLVYRAVGVRSTTVRQVPTVPVVVAVRDLIPGAVIAAADLKTAAWSGPVPKGAVGKTDGILQRGVAAPIFEGEPVTEPRLAPLGSGGGLAGTIPPGMRACAVRVNEVAGVAGFAVAGMRVDVLVSGVPPGGNPLDGPRARTLLQNIQVLSAGINFQKDQTGKPEPAQVVNLLVTPSQAEILSLAGNDMHLQLSLRNPMDTEILKPTGAVQADLLGGVRGPDFPTSVRVPPSRPRSEIPVRPERAPAAASIATVAAPAAPKPWVVDVVNGSVHTVAQFSQSPP